jgi:GcrA cell cycle regulator
MASWTEKRVERLKLFHKEGFSATLIARKLGPSFTKGMVAGKIHRLGLTVKPMKKGSALLRKAAPGHTAPPISKAQPRKPIPAPAHPILVSRPTVRSSLPLRPIEPINGLQIFDLRETHCRWPLGHDRPAKFFCGAPTIAAKSWCEHHYRLAYGHRPTHQNPEVGKSPGQMLLQALQKRSKSRQGDTVQRST